MADIKQAIEYAKQNPNSQFATELRRRIETGQLDKELTDAGLLQKQPERGIVATIKDIPSDIIETGKNVVGAIKGGYDTAKEAVQQSETGELSIPSAGAKMLGAVGSGVAKGFGDIITGTGKIVASPALEQTISKKVQDVITPIVSNPQIQSVINKYESLPIEQKTIIDSALGITEGLTTLLGGEFGNIAKKGIQTGIKTAEELASKGISTLESKTGNLVAKGKELVSSATSKASELAQATELSRIPSRIQTNIQSKIATEKAIKSLPSETAKIAVRDGIDIIDVRQLENIKNTVDKKLAKELIDTVKQTQAGSLVKDPIEVVGKPIAKRIKELDIQANKIGQQLNDVSQNLGVVTKQELTDAVFNKLKSVSGLKGLKLDNGKLDFSGTTISSSFTKTDRQAIQNAFTQATKWGNGQKAHKFRQELFEILDGKKKSLENITGTQEKGLQAIRQGLADVLESKNPQYKALNKSYASITKPLTELRKMIKASGNVSEDILDMNAGILARRLSSTSISQGQLRSVLQALDKVTGGTTKESVESLQDLYNILNRYYDIAPRTGFAGQTKSAIDSSMSTIAKNAIKNVAGESVAVRQKALESLLQDILK